MRTTKKKKELTEFLNYFDSYVDYDENRSYCDCDSDDYCRCTTVSPVINSIYYDDIINCILNEVEVNEIQSYCIDRIIRKTLSLDSFNACSVSGYYGEETKITLNPDTRSQVLDLVNKIISATKY